MGGIEAACGFPIKLIIKGSMGKAGAWEKNSHFSRDTGVGENQRFFQGQCVFLSKQAYNYSTIAVLSEVVTVCLSLQSGLRSFSLVPNIRITKYG